MADYSNSSRSHSQSSSPQKNKGYLSNFLDAFNGISMSNGGNGGEKSPVTFQVNSVSSSFR